MSKHKHYALSQMKDLRQQYVEMVELGKRNQRALISHKAKLREHRISEGLDEWEQIKRQTKQLRLW
jgi:hypothetical protein